MDEKKLQDILLNRDGARQLVISDVDGCMHRGLNPRLFRGISNADLCYSLFLAMSPYHSLRKHMLGVIKIALRKLGGADEAELILTMSDEVLEGVPYELVKKLSKRVAKFSHPNSLESLAIMALPSDLVIISKAFEPVVKAYADRFRKYEIYPYYDGNILKVNGSQGYIEGLGESRLIGLSETRQLLTRDDKRAFASARLWGSESAVIIGDTDEDLGMYEASKDLGLRTVLVAINSKHGRLSRLSDFDGNWRELNDLLNM